VTVRVRKPGDQIGSYKLLAKLGAGGMGETWLARAPAIDKKVVIKCMLVELSAYPRAHQYFASEGALGARLHHQNIINLLDRLSVEGVEYIVFEYVEGVDVEKLLQACRRLPVDMTVFIAVKILEALDYVHNATIAGQRGNIVHRDVTPDNVIVSAAGEVKLGDWGIAQVAAGLRERTRIPGIAGKPRYLSPEMASRAEIGGTATAEKPLDHRADLFQVGLIVYECLTGSPAFSGQTHTIAECQYRPISSLVDDVPPPIVRAVEALMQKRPEDRPQTAAQAAELLIDACPKFYSALQPLKKAVLKLTDVSASSTFAVPDAMRAMMAAAIKGETAPDVPAAVIMTAGTDDRTAIPVAPVRDAASPKTPFLDDAVPQVVEEERSPRASVDAGSAVRGRPTKYVRALPLAGVRRKPRRWLLPLLGTVGAVAVGGGITFLAIGAKTPAAAPSPPVTAPSALPSPPPVVPAPSALPAAVVPSPVAPSPVAPSSPAPPPSPSASSPKRLRVKKAAERVEPKVPIRTGEIVIREESPPIKELRIDGVILKPPIIFTVDPGVHEVTITRAIQPGVQSRQSQRVMIAAGERKEVK
jgi:serine/threonine-protein kinase